MNSEFATLVAASIAAISSVVCLLFTLRASKLSELRVAHRRTLETSIRALGEALHETVATSVVLLKVRSDTSVENWRNRSQAAKSKFQVLGPKLRYPLWGITEDLRTLSRMPDWVEHARPKYPDHAKRICAAGTGLSRALDRSIKNCYVFGRTPTVLERVEVRLRALWFRRTYKIFQAASPSAAADALP